MKADREQKREKKTNRRDKTTHLQDETTKCVKTKTINELEELYISTNYSKAQDTTQNLNHSDVKERDMRERRHAEGHCYVA